MGLGNERSCSKPHKIESDVLKGGEIVSVVCGVRHTLCLDDRGRVFSFGHGANGRLGHGDTKDRLSPTLSGCCLLRWFWFCVAAAVVKVN